MKLRCVIKRHSLRPGEGTTMKKRNTRLLLSMLIGGSLLSATHRSAC
ncbi:hypothetical protein QF006_001058 [Pantoea agglomerans]|nr:hypothetical protein [Pantoea agglomerans]